MTISKPRVLYDSIPYRCGMVGGIQTLVSTDDTDTPVANLGNMAAGSKWSPEPVRQILTNGDLLLWAGGASAAPDGWSLSGAGASVAQLTTPHHGLYGASVTRAGADAFLYQELASPTSYRGKRVTLGAWVRDAGASTARVLIADGVGASATNAGGSGDWEFVSVTRTINQANTLVQCRMDVITVDGTADFTHPILVIGDTVDETPEAPATAYAYFHRADGQLLNGWYFDQWTNGVAAAPDSWTLTGASAVAYLTMGNSPKVGHTAAGITRAGTDCYYTQSLTAVNLAKVLGKYISAGAWAYATVASRAYLEVVITHRDSSTTQTYTSSAHTGGSSYEWLEYENIFIPHDATAVAIRLSVKTGNTSVEWSGAWLGLGATATQTPHSSTVTAFSCFGHNLGTSGGTVVLQHSTDQSTWSDAFTAVNPSNDFGIWRDFGSLAKSYWRVKVTGGAGTQRPYLGFVSFGEYLELPHYLTDGWDPYQRTVRGVAPESGAGYAMGRTMLREPRRIRIRQEQLTEAEMEALVPWLDACGSEPTSTTGSGRGHPFVFQWDDGDHESWGDTGVDGGPLLCHIPSGQHVKIPLTYGIRVSDLTVECRAVAL